MFFNTKSDNRKPLLFRKNALNEDSYILYKGSKTGIVSSALIDIEVNMKNQSYIKSKMIIDPNDKFDVLKMRICEIIEKFPKLSGLNGLIANDLCIKTEKGLVQINSEECMGNSIKSKDLIIFDLIFSEIWLDFKMTIKSKDEKFNISFDLKVPVDSFISYVKDILVKMGIQSWAKYTMNNKEHPDDYDYYLFSTFSLNFSDKEGNYLHKEIELDNFNEKIKDRFNFESKIECNLELLNFTEIIYKEIARISEEKNGKKFCAKYKDEMNRKKVVRKFINDNLEKFCKSGGSNSKFAYHQNVVWRWSDDHEQFLKERRNSYLLNNSYNDSRRESIVVDDDPTFGYTTNPRQTSHLADTKGCKINISFALIKTPSFENLRKTASQKFDKRYTQDIESLKEIDFMQLINNLSGCFCSNREFKHLDEPYTRNFLDNTRDNSLTNIKEQRNSFRNSFSSAEDFTYNNFKKKYKYIKRNIPYIMIIAFALFIIFVIIYKSN